MRCHQSNFLSSVSFRQITFFALLAACAAQAQTAFTPTHRYSFTNAAGPAPDGSAIVDSLGGPNGTVRGNGATFTGSRVTIPGGSSASAAYVDLPNGLLSVNSTNNGGPGKITIEAWLKITGLHTWSRIFDFGSSDIGGRVGGEVNGPGGGGEGLDYLMWSAQAGDDGTVQRVELRNEDPVGGGIATVDHGTGNFFPTPKDFHVALTWDEATGQIRIYENGVQVSSMTVDDSMSQIHDVNVWLGRSNWTGDQNMQGEFDEFRTYSAVLSAGQILASYQAGPETLSVGPAAIQTSPQNVTVQEAHNATFTVRAVGDVPLSLSWYTNGVLVAGATGTTFTVVTPTLSQSGLQVLAVASNNIGGNAYSATSQVATLSVSGDATPPALVQVRTADPSTLELIFSEGIRAADANNAALFSLSGGAGTPTINNASVGTDAGHVVLALSAPLPNCGFYTLSANGIHDLSAGGNVTNISITFWNYSAAGLTHRYTFNTTPMADATGATITDIVSGANGVVRNGSGTTTLTGNRVTLSGGSSASAPYVDLPNGLLSSSSTNNGGSGRISIEGWVKVTGNNSWSRVFDFGSSGPCCAPGVEVTGPGGGVEGIDYFFYSAQVGFNTFRRRTDLTNRDQADHGTTGAEFNVSNFNQDVHFVVTWDEQTGRIITYEDGVQVASMTTVAAMSEINDVNVWLGRSNWAGDGNMQGEFDDFRTYNTVLSPADVQLNQGGGADNNFGSLLGLNFSLATNTFITNTVAPARLLAVFSNAGTQDVAAVGSCVSYSSSESNIAYVSGDGIIHTGTNGTVTLTAVFGGRTNSQVIDVTADSTPPTLVSARADGTHLVEVIFSEPVEQGTAEEAGNYFVYGQTSTNEVISAQLLSNPSHVLLTLRDPLPLCENITVLVSFVADQSPLFNQIADNSPVSFVNYVPPNLQHRYTFNNPPGPAVVGTAVFDGVGSADGTIQGGDGTFTGDRVVLPGGLSASTAYVALPSGLLSTNAALNGGSGQVTFEGWVKVTGGRNWGRIFDFGDGVGVEGKDYFMLSATIGTDTSNRRTEVRNEDPAGGGITTVDHGTTGFNRNQHFAVTWNEQTGQVITYEDGVFKSSMTVDDKMSDITDVNCWLGRSNWTQDDNMQGEFDEFRIYNRVLGTNDFALNIALGPDLVLGQPLALRISVPTNTLQFGQTMQVGVRADFSTLSNVDLTSSHCFTVSSSDRSVILPDASGLLHAVGNGTANVIVVLGGASNSVPVTVVGGTAPALDHIAIQRTGNGYTVSFHGTPGTTYRIQRTPSLNPPVTWTDISTQTAPAGGVISVEDTNPPAGQAFYRAITP